jgi:energy-coupling factor transporter ATP-binding protein EcfA2
MFTNKYRKEYEDVSYNFSSLNFADFEDLVLDLIGREIGVRFEGFAEGPDGGIDGRHAKGILSTVLQAKHYLGSPYSALKSKMKLERRSINKLCISRYILVTSHPLTPANKKELAEIIGPALKSESDIFNPTDLNALIRKFPDIEKAHIKLWLTGKGVLERVIYAASHAYNNITVNEIEDKLRVFAPNPSLEQAQKTLEDNHVVIISGPPGVGKTTLAEMLSYAYIAEEWKVNAIRSLDDGFVAINIDDKEKQIFLFDDFLGKIALDSRSLSHKDSDLLKFINSIRKSPNARFILTTRAYIFEEARLVSEHLDDQRLNISKYVLDVGVYNRRIKARILYNHLLVAQTPMTHISALIKSGEIAKIVDHRNYNPRIIEWMTDETHIKDIIPEEYTEAFIHMLDNPRRLWDKAFRKHISKKCQHLLFALFFSSEYGVNLNDLEGTYNSLHPHLCSKYGEVHDPKDFEESLKILEGGFITIKNRDVRFVNPSLKDYLAEYLNDLALISNFPTCATQSEWAKELWMYGKEIIDPSVVGNIDQIFEDIFSSKEKPKKQLDELKSFALSFISVAENFLDLPVWKREVREYGYSMSVTGLSNTERIELLLKWWGITQDIRFAKISLSLADNPVDGLSSWRDGEEAVELIYYLRDGDYYEGFPFSTELADKLETAYLSMLEQDVSSDDLEKISDVVENNIKHLGENIINAVKDVVHREFDDVKDVVSEIDSESTLDDHIIMLKKLGERASINSQKIDGAVEIAESRIVELQEEEELYQASTPDLSSSATETIDKFDDLALNNLFSPLLDV